MAKIVVEKQLKCGQCGHRWNPRQEEVRICPHCKTAYWDVKKRK